MAVLQHLRRPTVRAARYASRLNRVTRYGLDLVLWSRLLSSRRDPLPLDVSDRILREKKVRYAPPALHVSGPPGQAEHWADGFAAVHAALFLNLNRPDVLSPVRYAHPAPSFQGVYLWDSAFIAQVWKVWDPTVALEVNRAVVELRDGDRLQHVVADLTESPYTQPPLVAWSVARLHASRPIPGELLEAVYEPLVAYNRWLGRNRRFHGGELDGLYFWLHPYESGVENAPRFSSRSEDVLADTRRLAAPDLCAYVVLQLEALSDLADALGRGLEAARFRDEAAALRERVEAGLWDEDDGLYYDRHVDGHLVRSKTIASLLPLWAGIPSEARASRLRDHCLDRAAFNTLVPLPSVARDDPDFAKDMWRGPVWINTAYGVLRGLDRYGFEREASDLAFRLCDGVYRTYGAERRIFEFYDPERFDTAELTRKEGNRWKQVTLGGKPVREFVGWSGLVNTLAVERLVGLRREGGRLELRPRFPDRAAGLGFSLRSPLEGATVDLDVLPEGRTRWTVRTSDGVRRGEAAFGEAVGLGTPAPAPLGAAPVAL